MNTSNNRANAQAISKLGIWMDHSEISIPMKTVHSTSDQEKMKFNASLDNKESSFSTKIIVHI
jgi:hypothetical protein